MRERGPVYRPMYRSRKPHSCPLELRMAEIDVGPCLPKIPSTPRPNMPQRRWPDWKQLSSLRLKSSVAPNEAMLAELIELFQPVGEPEQATSLPLALTPPMAPTQTVDRHLRRGVRRVRRHHDRRAEGHCTALERRVDVEIRCAGIGARVDDTPRCAGIRSFRRLRKSKSRHPQRDSTRLSATVRSRRPSAGRRSCAVHTRCRSSWRMIRRTEAGDPDRAGRIVLERKAQLEIVREAQVRERHGIDRCSPSSSGCRCS